MKMLYISNARLPSPMAHGLQIIQNCEAFADTSIEDEPVEVTLWVPHTSRSESVDDLWAFYGVKRNFQLRRLPCMDLLHLTGTDSFLYRLLFYLQYGSFSLVVLIASLFTAVDVIYSRDPLIVALIGSIRRFRPRRMLIYEVHQFATASIGRRIQRWALTLSDLAVAITEPLRDKLQALQVDCSSPTPIIVAHDGIRRARFESLPTQGEARKQIGTHQDVFVVGYVGRLQTLGMSKGLDTLIDAISRLQDRGLRLLVVGGPEDTVVDYRAQWQAHGLSSEYFIYAGQVAAEAVPVYLAACDVLAMPLPFTEHFAQFSSPMKLFEYMAAGASGAAILATDLPSWSDVVQDGVHALLVPPSDSAAMAAALKRLRDDPVLCRRLGAAASELVFTDYTWEARAQKILVALCSTLR
jgi:glycosyltransferase involved in cell wall biosynthesis